MPGAGQPVNNARAGGYGKANAKNGKHGVPAGGIRNGAENVGAYRTAEIGAAVKYARKGAAAHYTAL